MNYIKRDDYLDFLIRHKDKQVIKVVSGIRRCGKSTLLDIYKDYLLNSDVSQNQIISINFEDISNQDKDYKQVYYEIKSKLLDEKMNYLFLDEIQNLKSFEKMVDSLFLIKNIDIYITGSNAYFMSGELATFLSGRYVELKMLPLSFKEYVDSTPSSLTILEKYNKYITYSSFPYTLHYSDDFQSTQDYLLSIYQTIFLKDIVQRYEIRDTMMLQSVISFVFFNIGSRLSTSNITNTLISNGRKTNQNTVEKYLQALSDSLLVYQVKRYNLKGKEILKSIEKYYVSDLGIRYLLCGVKGQDEGHIFENIIYLELLRRGYDIYVGQNNDNEIDFIAIKNNEPLFIQVTLTMRNEETYRREITPLKKLKNSYPKIILTMDEAPIKDDGGIKIIYAFDWLLKKS